MYRNCLKKLGVLFKKTGGIIWLLDNQVTLVLSAHMLRCTCTEWPQASLCTMYFNCGWNLDLTEDLVSYM